MFLTNVAIGNSHPWYVILCHTLVRIQRDSCIDRSWPVISGISAFSSTAYRTTIYYYYYCGIDGLKTDCDRWCKVRFKTILSMPNLLTIIICKAKDCDQ